MAPPRRSASLARRYPNRFDVPLLLITSAVLLAIGITTPAIETTTLFFWRDEYSIYMNVLRLGRDGRAVAATIVAVCSIVYPASKLLIMLYFWFMPFPYRWRSRVIGLLRLLGRWSMVDVLTISAIVLGSLTIGPLQSTPRAGLYCFAAGIITLMIVSLMMDRLARVGRS